MIPDDDIQIFSPQSSSVTRGRKKMKHTTKKDPSQKKPYLKPGVKQVQLRPEEAVLGGCKISGGGTGPANPTSCNPLGLPCNALGTS